MAWHYERIGKSHETGRGVISPAFPKGFKRPRHRRTDRDDATSAHMTGRNGLGGGDWNFAPFSMDGMIGDRISSDRPKSIETDMKRNFGPIETRQPEGRDKIGREVHARRGCCCGARHSRIKGLVPSWVFREAPDIRRNREFPVGLKTLIRFFSEPNQQLTAAEISLDRCRRGPSSWHAGTKFDQVPAPETLSRLRECAPFAVVTSPKEENFNRAPGPETDAMKPRRNHSAVIDHK